MQLFNSIHMSANQEANMWMSEKYQRKRLKQHGNGWNKYFGAHGKKPVNNTRVYSFWCKIQFFTKLKPMLANKNQMLVYIGNNSTSKCDTVLIVKSLE